jgi:hypothetical protein
VVRIENGGEEGIPRVVSFGPSAEQVRILIVVGIENGGEEGILRVVWFGPAAEQVRILIVVGIENGGEEGIRTPDTVSGIPDFESGAFSHSATSPLVRMLGTPTRTGRVCSGEEKVN